METFSQLKDGGFKAKMLDKYGPSLNHLYCDFEEDGGVMDLIHVIE